MQMDNKNMLNSIVVTLKHGFGNFRKNIKGEQPSTMLQIKFSLVPGNKQKKKLCKFEGLLKGIPIKTT